MRCIAGNWTGLDVELVDRSTAPKLQSVRPAGQALMTVQSLLLSEFGEPVVLDRGVRIRLARGLVAALIPLAFALAFELTTVPLVAEALLLIAVCVFIERSVTMNYVVEFRAPESPVGLVLEMDRAEWLPVILASRGYARRTKLEPGCAPEGDDGGSS